MLVEIGIAALFLAFLSSAVAVLLALIGYYCQEDIYITSARNALYASFPLLTLVAILLIYAQYTGIYEIAYVTNVSKDVQPVTLKITGLWGAQAGSLILWSWMLSLFTCSALWLNWKSHHHLMPWVIITTGVTLGFFLLLNNFYENVWERTWAYDDGRVEAAVFAPEGTELAYPYQSAQGAFYYSTKTASFPTAPDARYDGHGLNPLLRHPGMIIHPPLLYLGFTGFIIPFAFSIAALVKGDLGTGWMRATRRWSLIAWMFLSLGLVLGGRWAYDVLGWGGYWGWDPVENSSFLPWLTGTAFLHSVMIQEKRGMLKGWNVVMIMLTYLLVLFGTVATRTGLLSSVHSFAQSPLSVPMGLFLTLTVLFCVGLFLWRGSQGMFENDHALESFVSRESLFLFNNWVFLALTVVIFWGTWAELFTGLAQDAGLMGNTINLGREYYEAIVPYLFIILYILMGVAPLAAWRKASAQNLGVSMRFPFLFAVLTSIACALLLDHLAVALGIGVLSFAGYATLLELYKGTEARHRAHDEAWLAAFRNLIVRNRRRYGGYVIHLGVVVMGLGIIASTIFQEVRQETLLPGDRLDIGSYSLRYDQLVEATADDGRGMVIAETTLFRNDNKVTELRPRRDFFEGSSSPMTIAGLHSTVENDVYVLLTFWEGNEVTFRIYRNPLVNFVWWGSLLLILGTVIAIYPEREKQAVAVPKQRRVLATAAGD